MPLTCILFYDQCCHQKFNSASNFKPGFHIVVSVVSVVSVTVVRKKFIGQIEFILSYNKLYLSFLLY